MVWAGLLTRYRAPHEKREKQTERRIENEIEPRKGFGFIGPEKWKQKAGHAAKQKYASGNRAAHRTGEAGSGSCKRPAAQSTAIAVTSNKIATLQQGNGPGAVVPGGLPTTACARLSLSCPGQKPPRAQ